MTLETLALGGAKWVWEQYGKTITDKALGKAQEQWARFRWQEAETKYRARMYELHSTTRLLGNPKPITIGDIFSEVYVLDTLSAFKRIDPEQLKILASLYDDSRRTHALRLIEKVKRLFILGKPGAGKTTLLKYLTLQACTGKIVKTPILVSLKGWADSGMALMPFIVEQFEICAFPDAQTFIEHLLEQGNALVLFDGLDEVNQEGEQRARMISKLADFSKRYHEVQICLTCRIAATDYSFDQFFYVEIADFDERQFRQFVSKWYHDDPLRYGQLMQEFEKPENKGLRELARTPLLLALLCLAFDESLSFPSRRVDLYREALDALLKKWDASRGIRRDEIYRKLSPGRKEQMLARLAAQNFEEGNYFIKKDMLVKQIAQYLQQLPNNEDSDASDGEIVLKAMEAQHGILVEPAHNIYSFSHLTFQEYFTARYVVDNAASGTVARLIRSHFVDTRWWEVFLLTTSLLDNSDAFFEGLIDAIAGLIQGSQALTELITWSSSKASASKKPGVSARTLFFLIAVAFIRPANRDIGDILINLRNKARNFAFSVTGIRTLQSELARVHILDHAEKLAEYAGGQLEDYELDLEWNLDRSQIETIGQYFQANTLLFECLSLAAATDRKGIEKRILSWPLK